MKGIQLAIIVGLVAGVVLRGFDYLLQSFLPKAVIDLLHPYNALEFILALLYGGIVEELLMRFGVMSLLVFVLWKLFDRKSAKPSNWVFIFAISVAALIFAIGHYGPTALATEMTPFIWFRMILLNGLPGFFFGWLYWKHNLELAMLSHMVTHIVAHLLMLIFF
ncbi:CPBP family glutamic-type intramembrane protease [Pseudogracilibacillus sp. SO30301A]|uniref:CPBP family glutamic-type intramembrane protease n=1 Tax=Pseudogracilibacillus sp. SO30301A TaxID=3098291 RepID=UPI00300E6D86